MDTQSADMKWKILFFFFFTNSMCKTAVKQMMTATRSSCSAQFCLKGEVLFLSCRQYLSIPYKTNLLTHWPTYVVYFIEKCKGGFIVLESSFCSLTWCLVYTLIYVHCGTWGVKFCLDCTSKRLFHWVVKQSSGSDRSVILYSPRPVIIYLFSHQQCPSSQ